MTRAILATGLIGVVIGSIGSLFIAATANATATGATEINFQGKLVNTDGTNVSNGTHSVVFKLYSASSGGSALWTESDTVTTTDGVFEVDLGAGTALPASADFTTGDLYLGITVGSDAEMSPRIHLTAAAYAFYADNSAELGGLAASAFAQLSPGTAQSGFLNVTGNITAGSAATVQGGTIDATTNFSANGSTGAAVSCSSGQTNLGAVYTEGILTTAGTCTTVPAAGTYLSKISADTASVSTLGQLYTFTNTNTGAAGVLGLVNDGTNSALTVTQAANPTSGQAALLVNDTASSPTGNLLDLQVGAASKFAVDVSGNVTQNGGTSTTDTINGQTISASASFTGTVAATTSVTTPDVITPLTQTADASGATTALTVRSGNSSTNSSGNVSIVSGTASGSGHSTGNVSIDAGAPSSSATAGQVNIGQTNASSINIGSTGSSTVSSNVNIANSSAGVQTVGIGSTNSTSGTTINGGSNGIGLNGNTTVSSGKNFTVTSGVFTQGYTTAVAGSGQLLTFANTNSSAGVGVQGINITPTNTTAASSGTNTLNVVNFAAGGALAASDTTNGINFASATGYSNFISSPNFILSSAGAITGATGITSSNTIQGATLNATSGFSANGTSGTGVTCSSGQANLGAVYAEGILTTAGTCTTVQAAGNYLVQGPTTAAQNTVQSTGNAANGVDLTLDATSGTGTPDILDVGPSGGGSVLAHISNAGNIYTNGTLDTQGSATLNIGTSGSPTDTGISLNNNTTVAAGKNLILPSGTGQFQQTYSNTTAGSGQALSFTNAVSGAASSVQGINIGLVNTTSATGNNVLTGINFLSSSLSGTNITHAINFASNTGYTDFLSYNGTSLLSNTGILQNAAFSTTNYSNIQNIGNGSATPAAFTVNGNASSEILITDGTHNTAVKFSAPSASNYSVTFPTPTTGNVNVCYQGDATGCGFLASTGSYINNQSITSTAQSSASFNIDTSGRAGVSFVAPLFQTLDVASGSSNSTALVVRSGNVSGGTGGSGNVTLQSGNVTSASGGAPGSLTVDSGSPYAGGVGGGGFLNLGNTNASSISLGNSVGTLTVRAAASGTSLQVYNNAQTFSTTLNFTNPTTTVSLTVPNAGTTLCTDAITTCSGGGSIGTGYIQNQNTSAQTAAFYISSSGRSSTSFLAPAFDTATGSGTVGLGTTNAGTVDIGTSGGTTAVAIQGNGTSSAVSIQAATGGTIAIGTVNQAATTVNIGTGASSSTNTDAVTVGSTNSTSTATVQGGTGISALTLTTGAAGVATLSTGANSGGNSGAITIQTGNGTTGSNNAGSVTIDTGTHAGTSTSSVNSVNVGTANALGVNIGNTGSTATVTTKAGNTTQTQTTSGDTIGNSSGSATAFQVQNTGSANVLGVDTTALSTNLVTNPSFEGSSGSTTGWAGLGTPPTLSAVNSGTIIPYSGSYSLKIPGVNSGDGAKYVVALASSTQYSFSLYAQLGASSMSTFEIGYSNTGASPASCATAQTVTSTGWTRITCVFTTGTTSGGAYVYARQTDTTTRSIYIDGVYLQQTGTSNFSAFGEGKLTTGGVITSPVAMQNATNSTTAFQVQNATGTTLFNVDTVNSQLTVGGLNISGNTVTPSGTFTLGSTGQQLSLQGNASSSLVLGNGTHTLTLSFAGIDTSANTVYQFAQPTTAVNNTSYTICTSAGETACNTVYQPYSSNGYLAKNAVDTSQVGLSSQTMYAFTNTGSASASSILSLDNGAGTNSTLIVKASGNPSAGQALILVNAASSVTSGNLLDLQVNSTSKFSVDVNGTLTQAGGSSTTDTINGQTISSAANFTGTVTAATAVITPLLKTADVSGATAALVVRSGNSSANSSGNVSFGSGTASGSGNASGNVTIDSGSASSSATTGQVSLGAANATQVNIGNTGSANTGAAGTTTIQGGSGGVTITPASSANVLIGNAGGSGSITLGSSTLAQTVLIGNGSGNGTNFETVSIANAGTVGATDAVNIAAGTYAIDTVAIGSTNSTSTVAIKGGSASTAVALSTGTTGGISETAGTSGITVTSAAAASGTTGGVVVSTGNNSGANSGSISIDVGTGSTAANAGTVGIGATNASQTTIGNTLSTSKTILQGGATSETIVNAGDTLQTTTNSTTAYQVQNASVANIFGVDTTAVASNLITNPSFEGTSGSTTGWSQTTGATLSAVNSGTIAPYAGNYSLKDLNTATANAGPSYAVALTNGQVYSLTFYAEASATTTTLDAGYYTTNNTTDTSCAPSVTVVSTGWTRVSCTFTAASGTNGIYVKQTDATGRTLYFDGFYLQQTSTGSTSAFADGKILTDGVFTTPIALENTTNSTTAFMVQNAGGTSTLLTVDTLNGQVIFGSGGNTATISSSGAITLAGNARHSKNIVLTAEYAGAVLNASGSNNVGTMTAAYDSADRFGYYDWVNTLGTAQSYDVVVTVPVPDDWSSWTGSPTFWTYGTTGSSIAATITDTAGATATNYNAAALTVSTTWTARSVTTPAITGTYTPGSTMTIRIHLVAAATTGDVRIGTITIPYKSAY